ncbi:MAG: hypothetical protein ACYTGP_12520, partial [Planctomycetota bacterium]
MNERVASDSLPEVRVAPADADAGLVTIARRIASEMGLPESPPATEAPADNDMLLLVVTDDG